jgi:hypothetical protein
MTGDMSVDTDIKAGRRGSLPPTRERSPAGARGTFLICSPKWDRPGRRQRHAKEPLRLTS